jgi:hypothetical protein
VTIEPRSSRYRRRQINHLATDGVLAKDRWSTVELKEFVPNFEDLAVAYTEAHAKPRMNPAQALKARVAELEAQLAQATEGKPKRGAKAS